MTKKVLIIGLGNIAGGYNEKSETSASLTHAKAIKKNDFFSLEGCVDPDKERLADFSDFWGEKTSIVA